MGRAILTAARNALRGFVALPGDKSISQRRALMSLFVSDDVTLTNYGTGEDCLTALACVQQLGKTVARSGSIVQISGEAGCKSGELNCGNSGTCSRLLMGILAGHEGEWQLTGDESLSRRPMKRVAKPLRKMGARIDLQDGHLPAHIRGGSLQGIIYHAQVISAQVKTAVLLAGLRASGSTFYFENSMSRNHTEHILNLAPRSNGWIALDPTKVELTGKTLSALIPSDPSSAAFWIAAALMVPDSELEFPGLLSNPLRNSYFDLLRGRGAMIAIQNRTHLNGEHVIHCRISYSPIGAFSVAFPETIKLIDEIPAFAILATAANGRSVFLDASELRVKESDRLKCMTEGLVRMGAEVEVWSDNFAVTGPVELQGAEIETAHDHRIAMAFAIAGLAATSKTIIQDAECVAVSYPDFWKDLERLAPGCIELEP
jgi:3-phosphoshikimate 1-carboxyvinyltransferase